MAPTVVRGIGNFRQAAAGAGAIDDDGFFIKLFGRANREACEVGAGADDDADAALLLFIAAGASAAATAAVLFIPGGDAVPEAFHQLSSDERGSHRRVVTVGVSACALHRVASRKCSRRRATSRMISKRTCPASTLSTQSAHCYSSARSAAAACASSRTPHSIVAHAPRAAPSDTMCEMAEARSSAGSAVRYGEPSGRARYCMWYSSA